MAAPIDHLVYAVPDLGEAVDQFHARTGLRPAAGGSHVGRGTANYLVGLGSAYLELIGPDPAQPDHLGPRPFGVSHERPARLATWAIRPADLDSAVATARRAGFDPGEIVAMSRATPTGEVLSWRLTMSDSAAGDGLVPFLIDWGTSPHPTTLDLPHATLLELSATHPHPDDVRTQLRALDADLDVRSGPRAELHAALDTPHGRLEL